MGCGHCPPTPISPISDRELCRSKLSKGMKSLCSTEAFHEKTPYYGCQAIKSEGVSVLFGGSFKDPQLSVVPTILVKRVELELDLNFEALSSSSVNKLVNILSSRSVNKLVNILENRLIS